MRVSKPAIAILMRLGKLVLPALLIAGFVSLSPAFADAPKTAKKKPAAKEIILPQSAIPPKVWLSASTKPLQSGEIDRIIGRELQKAGVAPADRCSDEEFLRRAYLDLTGELPSPADIRSFLSDQQSDKRAKVIDRLLGSDKYAKHWAVYWRNVISARVTDNLGRILAGQFERWINGELAKNTSWATITKEIITATGEYNFRSRGSTTGTDNIKNGAAFLYLSRRGQSAIEERASETARIFLGIQIQCAQCHDHPFDEWKREQFHQFAAYLARLRDRPIFEDKKFKGFKLVSTAFGEHRMKDLENPQNRGKTIYPKFLDGKAPWGFRLNDERRRGALADAITSKENPWFSAAFANRIWGELMGQSFYRPIDDLGPQREAIMPQLAVRLAGSFRGSNYDIKQMFRDIMNSDAYQRKIRLGKAVDQHVMFAGLYPNRMNAEALWNSLQCVLGRIDGFGFGGRRRGFGGFRRFGGGVKQQVVNEFGIDPSTRPEEVEGTIPQALLLMNNPQINRKVQATRGNLLARVLKDNPKNEEAVRALYMQAFTRQPSQNEMSKCLAYIQRVGNRAEAFEDILWVLINSTEFQTRR